METGFRFLAPTNLTFVVSIVTTNQPRGLLILD